MPYLGESAPRSSEHWSLQEAGEREHGQLSAANHTFTGSVMCDSQNDARLATQYTFSMTEKRERERVCEVQGSTICRHHHLSAEHQINHN